MMLILFLVFGYFLGSIPFGLILTRLAGLGDIRQVGSGNIGATNVLRTGNRPLALATLLLDGGKGALAVMLAQLMAPPDAMTHAGAVAGAAALIGHCFPVWISFRGGKGVATYLGTVFALFPPAGFLACFIWGITAAFTRISSLAALTAAALTPAGLFLWNEPVFALAAGLMSGIVFIRHRGNIARMRANQEPLIGRS